MAKHELSDEVRRFVEENIISIDQLETLLLLYREGRRDWTASEISAQLRNSLESAEANLNLLINLGICEKSKRADGKLACKFVPKHTEIGNVVASLAQVYSGYRITIVDLIYSRAKTKILALSEAFRIKKDEGGNG